MSFTSYHLFYDDIEVGQEWESQGRTVTQTDIVNFAGLSGDYNPIHVDHEFAKNTAFRQPIAHGMLTAGYISAVFGCELPGPGAIYVSQTLNFRAPVRVGDSVLAKVRVVELYPAKRRVRFECVCEVAGKVVLEGEAVLMVGTRPAVAAA